MYQEYEISMYKARMVSSFCCCCWSGWVSCFSLDSFYSSLSTRRKITLWSYTRTCNKYMFYAFFPFVWFLFFSLSMSVYRCVFFFFSLLLLVVCFLFVFHLICWSFVFMLLCRSVGLRHSTVYLYSIFLV